ncbi:MAG TPA: helix-turn-helix domain-containing protein [Trueperaceae bacterium]|nr:helix-turn-helix domain-containing protein [Trueperaceae bacterium]
MLGQNDTRRGVMLHLLRNREVGMTLDELAGIIGVSRNAIRQHITGLERDGLVKPIAVRRTGRRPSRAYGLTELGGEHFPRQYDRLALSLLEAIDERLGAEAAEVVLDAMVEDLALAWLPELGLLDADVRRERVLELMNDLGYHAGPAPDAGTAIRAVNCVFHNVARRNRAVCRFDEKLLSRLLGDEVRLTSCMALGDGSCVFAGPSDPSLDS